MSRAVIAACAVLLACGAGGAAEPKPLWELAATGGERAAAPAWVAFSPDGYAVVAVVTRATANPEEFAYQLRVWDARTRKERFTADLGTGKGRHWGDELAAFPTDDTVLTGGRELVTRSLENGSQTNTRHTGGLADFAVWSVPDLRETFHLRRDPDRHGKPVELVYRGVSGQVDEWSGRRYRPNEAPLQTAVRPPREGLRTDAVVLNPGRTRAVVSFRDEVPVSRPRHALVLYKIRTVEEYELDPVGEAENPHPGPVSVAAFARNGRTVATGGEDGSVCLWDVASAGGQWKPRATVSGASDHRVTAVAFSPDWRYLAAATWDRARPNLLLIDADEGRLVRAVRTERELTAVAWSPDGRTLLTAGASGKLKAWDVGALLRE